MWLSIRILAVNNLTQSIPCSVCPIRCFLKHQPIYAWQRKEVLHSSFKSCNIYKISVRPSDWPNPSHSSNGGGSISSHWYFHNFLAMCICIYTAFRIKMWKAIVIDLHFHIVSVYIHLNNTIHIHNIYGSPVSAGPYFLLLK